MPIRNTGPVPPWDLDLDFLHQVVRVPVSGAAAAILDPGRSVPIREGSARAAIRHDEGKAAACGSAPVAPADGFVGAVGDRGRAAIADPDQLAVRGRTRSRPAWAVAASVSAPPATVTVGKANLIPFRSKVVLILS